MDKDESQVEQPQCGCDSSSDGDVCCSPGTGKANWRTALFVAIVVLAGAVAAHSVLTNGGKATPCGGGLCAIDQGNGNGDACSKTSTGAVAQTTGEGAQTASCPFSQANGNGDACAKTAACPLEQANGNGDSGCCPSEMKACPKEAAAGCCPSEATDTPAPQPAPTMGCCGSEAPTEPAPQPAPTGCCPGH